MRSKIDNSGLECLLILLLAEVGLCTARQLSPSKIKPIWERPRSKGRPLEYGASPTPNNIFHSDYNRGGFRTTKGVFGNLNSKGVAVHLVAYKSSELIGSGTGSPEDQDM